ncbi:beta-ketoacyl-ACP synthase III [Streptomyces glomeratus]|uniref:Beta-ketoacyl-[acyl-carrier-protein] synthase III n=1 Tax=Streptomyces glomeratus TaxID=284452 RepID=A0ABP6L5S1_9ACTN|nr:beta-ketoacyl-ACP synthase III [Streptomyces glomeratus]MCF1509539.1 ketoacyl-ACP synthase III [Streptomyces glomeratus]
MLRASCRQEPRFGRIIGVGGYRPQRVVDNGEICRSIDSSEEWIETRSGIRRRHFATREETHAVMGAAAAEKAIAAAGLDPLDIGCVIVATTTNLVSLPAVAVDVAHRVGARRAGAFDLNAACAGFCYGVGTASAMIRSGEADHVLVVGAERLTDLVDPTDRQIAFLLADGAGAVVIGPSEEPGIGPVVWGADGDQMEAVVMTRSWGDYRHDAAGPPPVMRMDGRRVFRWAVDEMAQTAREAMRAAGVTVDDLAAFIPHQANMRITEVLAKELGLPAHVVVADDIVTTGNTSSASIPLAMEHMLTGGQAASGDLALLIGFGAGLTYAAQVVRLP